MKIKNRLTYLFAVIVGALLLVFSVSIYFFYAQYRERDFTQRLKVRALTTAQIIVEVEDVDPGLIKLLNAKDKSVLYHEHVVIFLNRKEIFNTGVEKLMISKPVLDKIEKRNEYRFEQNEKEVIGITYSDHNGKYIIIVSGYDKYGFDKLQNLELILLIGWFIFILIVIGLGRFFADRVLSPISEVVSQVDNITASNLSARVQIGESVEQDELHQLAETFNRMLDRIQYAFESQKSFVSNASHELRTPLTSLEGQLEVGLISDRSIDEYKQILSSSLEDLLRLNGLLNGLLDLAQTDTATLDINFGPVRIDELVLTVIDECQRKFPHITISFEYENMPEEEEKLVIQANEQWLKTAVLNVIDNACKYSDNTKVQVLINVTDVWIVIKVIDFGIGIPEKEITKILEPFYRADNTKSIAGHGIGLSLSNKIFKIHKGNIQLFSNLGFGTRVFMALPVAK